MWGPMDINCRLSRRVLKDVPAAWVVFRADLTIFTCLSMKPFDLGYWGMKLYHQFATSACTLQSLEMRSGPLSLKIHLGGAIVGDKIL